MSNSAPFNITINPATTAPAWFTALTPNTWTLIGASSIQANVPSPQPIGNTGYTSITRTWNGAAVDQSRREFVIGASGGHNDYWGNEVYAISLGDATPTWRRTRTPSAQTGSTDQTNGPGTFADGQPTATHTYSRPCAGNGRLWLAGLDAQSGSSGDWTSATFSYDLTQQTNGVWNRHGRLFNTFGGGRWLGGSAAYDPVTDTVWAVGQYGDAGNRLYRIDCAATIAAGNVGATTQLANSTLYTWGSDYGYNYTAIAHDLRLLILVPETGSTIYTRDLTNPSAAWVARATSGTRIAPYPGHAVYHPASRALIGWTSGLGASVRVLDIPQNLSSTWTWRTVNLGGVAIANPGDSQGPWSKFNIVQDMGNGQACLVYYDQISRTGIYACRLTGAI